jgi:hypothetical protein
MVQETTKTPAFPVKKETELESAVHKVQTVWSAVHIVWQIGAVITGVLLTIGTLWLNAHYVTVTEFLSSVEKTNAKLERFENHLSGMDVRVEILGQQLQRIEDKLDKLSTSQNIGKHP